jgi:hypothetical protein
MLHTFDSTEVEAKLGGDHLFHIDPSPLEYSPIWKEPLTITFKERFEEEERIPDLQVHHGHMFFSEKAYNAIGAYLEKDGEFLPVVYKSGNRGYVFNIRNIAENSNALDDKLTTYNEWGDLKSIGFIEEKLPFGTMIFRAEADDYDGVFCTDAFKNLVEGFRLLGIDFQPDLSNIFGHSAETKH